ncbi:bacteriocin immunity protein, partial [Klebsiella pneumoniae]
MAGNKISDFTEEEFTAFVSKIIAADFPTDKENDDAIYSFAQLTEHPAGWNLIFKPKEGANKQVISSQADSLIKISRIWAD